MKRTADRLFQRNVKCIFGSVHDRHDDVVAQKPCMYCVVLLALCVMRVRHSTQCSGLYVTILCATGRCFGPPLPLPDIQIVRPLVRGM